MSYYDDLGVSRSATSDEIEKAYRALAQKYHPDKHPGREQQAAVAFKRLQEAWQVLKNPKARNAYDETLRSVESPDEDQPVGTSGGLARRESARPRSDSPRSYAESDPPKKRSFGLDWKTIAGVIGGLLVAAAAVATVMNRPPSSEEIAARERAKAEAKFAELQQQKQSAELDQHIAQRSQDSAIAKAKLKAIQLEGDRAQDSVRKLSEEIDAWDKSVPPLLRDEKGKLIAANDDRIRAFEVVWNKKRPNKSDANAIQDRIKILLEPVEAELIKTETVWQSNDALTEQLKAEITAIDRMTEEVRGQKRQVDRLVQVATREGKASQLTLENAIEDLAARDDTAKNNAVAAMQKENREKIAAAETARAKQEGEDQLRIIKARETAGKSDAEKAIEHDRLVARASSPETKALLAFFFTPGFHQPDGTDTAEKRPISLSRLDAQGCLDPSLKGQQQLLVYALLNGGDNDRPKWQEAPAVERLSEAKRAKLIEIQKALIELGPTLVELKLLDP